MTRHTDLAAVPVPSPVTAVDPTNLDLADLGERPPLVVVGTEPVTMVRTPPHGIPLRDAVQLGAAVFSPAQVAADRKVLADAGPGILDALDEALGNVRRDVTEQTDRPALAAFDDGHAAGHRDGLTAALRIVERLTDEGHEHGEDTDPGGLIRAELLGAIRDGGVR